MSSRAKISESLAVIGSLLCVLLLIIWLQSGDPYVGNSGLQHRSITLLYFLVLIALLTIAAWRKHLTDTRTERAVERAAAGFCPKCNYDRRGLDPAAACPECGDKTA